MLETILTSPEVSQKLFEADFDAETNFMWDIRDIHEKPIAYYYKDEEAKLHDEMFSKKEFPHCKRPTQLKAYTLEQIWDKLPDEVRYCHEKHFFRMNAIGEVLYNFADNYLDTPSPIKEENKATYFAKVWLWLKENNYITF